MEGEVSESLVHLRFSLGFAGSEVRSASDSGSFSAQAPSRALSAERALHVLKSDLGRRRLDHRMVGSVSRHKGIPRYVTQFCGLEHSCAFLYRV